MARPMVKDGKRFTVKQAIKAVKQGIALYDKGIKVFESLDENTHAVVGMDALNALHANREKAVKRLKELQGGK